MADVYNDTLKRENVLRQQGFSIKTIWSHTFYDKLRADPVLKALFASLRFPEPLLPRDAFFGGRTNAIKLHHQVAANERIMYYDVTSEYPYINKYGRYAMQ